MTLPDLLRRTASRLGNHPAIEFDKRHFTFADLEGGSNAASRVLRAHGARKGDRVALVGGSSLEWILAYLGALKLGAIALPVNPAYGRDELDWIFGDAAPKVVVADPERLADCAAHLAPAATALLAFGNTGHDVAGRRVFPFYESLKKAAVTPVDELVFDRDEALIIYTSGTTGRSKGAVLTHGNLVHNARGLNAAFAWTAEDRLLLALPLFHVHGLCVALHGAILAGCATLLLPRFDPNAVLAAMRSWRPTMFMGVPTMYSRLLDAAGAEPVSLPSLRLLVSGSAPLPLELRERVKATFGHDVLERYGMTETLITLAQRDDESRTPGTVGRPVDGIEVRVVDDEGKDAPDGQDGELWVRGGSIGPRYWQNDEATAASRVDGWFKTGDIVRRDPNGELRIVGRARDLIISGGYNIYPREVEEALLQHPAVAEAMVYGADDKDLGEAVCAQVVPAAGAKVTAEELVAFVKEHIASFKKPRRIDVVDALPRNEMGKVIRPKPAPRS